VVRNLVVLAMCGCSGASTAPPDVGSDAPAETQIPVFPNACPATPCAALPPISRAADLISLIDATTTWPAVGPYTTGCLTASDDVPITTMMSLRGDAIALPANCGSGCRQTVLFRLRDEVPGVQCVMPEQWYGFTVCSELDVQPTTLRLRMVMQDIHPSPFGNFMPVVEVLSACDAACATSSLSCGATHTCWSSVRDLCAYCMAGSNTECACWDGAGYQADGTSCTVWVSGDVEMTGTCSAGTCGSPQ
jgi:hypothetical protein